MRELKFRAWDKFNSEYIEIDDLYWFEENSVHDNNDAQYEIEQFTGLLDKNGKAIYEGDVIRLSDNVYDLYYGPGQIVVIEWDECSTGFKPFMDGHSDYDGVSGKQCEIIGTIHDAEYKELAK